MGGCQNDGPFLDPYYITKPNIQGYQNGTLILGTTHIGVLRGVLGGLDSSPYRDPKFRGRIHVRGYHAVKGLGFRV